MVRGYRLLRAGLVAGFALLTFSRPAVAQEPGIDKAALRFAVTTVGDGFIFTPSSLFVEQGEWVRWKSNAAATCHTTTQGNTCISSLCSGSTNNCSLTGPWDCQLKPGSQFTHQFPDAPGLTNFFCRPHCSVGMLGSVTVTAPIELRARDSGGAVDLTWAFGSGSYRVFHSVSPTFCVLSSGYPACTADTAVDLTALTGGTSNTSLTDSAVVGPGKVLYYLVINKSS